MIRFDRYHVLVPFQEAILHPTEAALDEVERLGVPVWRQPGCSAIDYNRNQMASAMLVAGKEAMLFVDSDILFEPVEALAILKRPEPIVAGIYPQKSWRADGRMRINADLGDLTAVGFGDRGADYEAIGVGAGFLRVRCDALVHIARALDLPCCTAEGGQVWPWFLPTVYRRPDGQWSYNGEDYSFCRRAREAGLKVLADTRIRLEHLGRYGFSWEEAGSPAPQHRRGGVIGHVPVGGTVVG